MGQVVAVVILDLEGSTRIRTRDGDPAAKQIFDACEQEVTKAATDLKARAQDWTGDEACVTFGAASDAVRFSLRIQELQRSHPKFPRMRVGAHLGEVDNDQGSFSGLPYHRASRVLSLAAPGQILLTATVATNARQNLAGKDGAGVVWKDHGEYEFEEWQDTPLSARESIFEVGHQGLAPLIQPTQGKRVRRYVPVDPNLEWKPARGALVPRRLNWRLLGPLGAGGFGEVWLAGQEGNLNKACFKFCMDPVRVRDLRREVRVFQFLHGALGRRDDIARLIDWELETPPHFMMSEYAPGGSLPDWIEAQGGFAKVPLARRLEILARAAEALHAAHSSGVLHKDVKPENILMSTRGPEAIPILGDFGIGAVIDSEALKRFQASLNTKTTQTGMSLPATTSGSLMYMAPEVRDGKDPSIQSDVFSLGVTLYQLVKQDFSAFPGSGLQEDIADPLLRQDIQKCLSRKPEERFGDAGALAQRLRALPARRLRRRLVRGLVVSGVALVVCGAVFVVSHMTGTAQERRLRDEALDAASIQRGAALAIYPELDDRRTALLARQRELRLRSRRAAERFVPQSERAETAQLETEIQRLHIEFENRLLQARDGLEHVRAQEEKYSSPKKETLGGLARYWVYRWRRAQDQGDDIRARVFLTRAIDAANGLAGFEELKSDGTLRMRCEPSEASVSVFRYEDVSHSKPSRSVVPRLVPTPVALRSAGDLLRNGPAPGDITYVIRTPVPGANLRAGDVIFAIGKARLPVGGMFAIGVQQGGVAASAGVMDLDAVEAFRVRQAGASQTIPFPTPFEWKWACDACTASATVDTVRIGARDIPVRGSLSVGALGIERIESGLALLAEGAPCPLHLCLVRENTVHELDLQAATRVPGAATAYPLLATATVPSGDVTLPEGSYLLVARAPQFAEVRYPVRVTRGIVSVVNIALPRREEALEGYVWIPPFKTTLGSSSLQAGGAEETVEGMEIGGFWCSETEVTNAEWFEFLNHKTNGASYGDSEPFVNGDAVKRKLAERTKDGWRPVPAGDDPMSWTPEEMEEVSRAPARAMRPPDIVAFLKWKNSQPRSVKFDIPTPREWEAIARGADLRDYPWGNRFDFSLCVSKLTASLLMRDAPARSCPTDESPFGVADMAGSAMEFTRDGDTYTLAGSGYSSSLRDTFLLASRRSFDEVQRILQPEFWGLRLVARPKTK